MRTALEYLKSLKVVTRREMLAIIGNCSDKHNDCRDCEDRDECKHYYDEFFCGTEDVVIGKHSAKAQ